MLTYWWPPAENVAGPAETEAPRRVLHTAVPLAASNATNCPSRPPANNRLLAVVRTPPSVDGAERRKVHLRWPVVGFMAMMELKVSSLSLPAFGKSPMNILPSWYSGGSSPLMYVVEV